MPRRTNTGKLNTIYVITSQPPEKKEPEWVYGYVSEKRFAEAVVKQLNARGETNGEVFSYRELKQMMPVNWYIEADVDWLKPVGGINNG